MFPADDPAYLAYRELQEQFGGNAVVMLVYQDNELTADAGIERNRIMTEQVAAIPWRQRRSFAISAQRSNLKTSTSVDSQPGTDAISAGQQNSGRA